MALVADILLSPQALLVSAWVGLAAAVHFRGRERYPFVRQLTSHSTVGAPINLLMLLFSAVPNRRFHDRADFPELDVLRENWQIIRDEARRLVDEGHTRPSQNYNDIAFNSFFRRGWTRFYLKWYGGVLESAEQLCPATVKLVESIPSIKAALFAVLPPGGRLGRHRDPFAGSLRYHLGLITPNSDDCRIYVDGERYSWRDGEDVVFDETFIHQARNDTDQVRVILFCDVARPMRFRAAASFRDFLARLAAATASNNVPAEQIGGVNRIAAHVYATRNFFLRLKRSMDRRLYYAGKYALMAAALYLFFLL